MRLLYLFIYSALFTLSLYAQDTPGPTPGEIFNQQIQQQQLASDLNITQPPRFSVKSGTYSSAVTLTLKSRTRHARIYYTVGDWTPTEKSLLYTGPITISASETINAIALAPHLTRSYISKATYTLPPSPVRITSSTALIPRGTPIHLQFLAALDSATAAAGQPITLALSEDLIVNGSVIAAQGQPVEGVLTEVEPARRLERPGILAFRVEKLTVTGYSIPLTGGETKEGNPLSAAKNLTVLIPVAGAATALRHGEEAHIAQGAEVTAAVDGDTALPPTLR